MQRKTVGSSTALPPPLLTVIMSKTTPESRSAMRPPRKAGVLALRLTLACLATISSEPVPADSPWGADRLPERTIRAREQPPSPEPVGLCPARVVRTDHRIVGELTDTISLAGEWRFRLDPDDEGERAEWHRTRLPEVIPLPGSTAEAGFGEDISVDTEWTGSIVDRSWFTEERYRRYRQPGNIKIPFWLQPRKHYVGAAWYQREVTIPPEWEHRRIVLHLERCHWVSRVWVDDSPVGTADSLSVPHVYDLSEHVRPGKCRLTVRMDNRLEVNVGPNSHSVSDHTQTNWNGMTGDISLRATDRVWIDDVQVYPDTAGRSVSVSVAVGNATAEPARGVLALEATCGDHRPPTVSTEFVCPPAGTRVRIELPLGADALLWDEFSPHVYTLQASLRAGMYRHHLTSSFGLREFKTRGTRFTINGRPTMLRGTLECCIFPGTGYPPTDRSAWAKVFRVLKAHGLNHLRFHSWCPPEAAFASADAAGVYLHVECGAWANQGATIGDGRPIDRFIREEARRILQAYGNHPSFCMMAYGNEPAGGRHKEFLGALVEEWKNADPRRLYTSAAGWPIIPESQFHSTPAPRIHQWGAGLTSRINADPPETRTDYEDFVARYEAPVVSHEIGQWCVYPNFAEIAKYTGVLKARNFEIFRDSLEAHHLLDQAHRFLLASGRLQALCYKEEIESALRTPGLGGFQLLDLHDFPGQGTALVGVLDPFWDEKGYITAGEFRRFSCETVPLVRMAKRVWTTDESFTAEAEVAHFGSRDLDGSSARWEVSDPDGKIVAQGTFHREPIRTGRLTSLGRITFSLGGVGAPTRLRVAVVLRGTPYANDWNIWVYPPETGQLEKKGPLIVEEWGDEVIEKLEDGASVLLVPAAGSVRGDEHGRVPPAFSPIFWNTAWTRRQPPHTLGILCDPAHPALAAFPTDYHSDWQWWDLVTKSQVLILDDAPHELKPIVRVIDDWVTNRRLGLVLEARVGAGRLLVCSMDIRSDLDTRPVAAQMRYSLLSYMQGPHFHPTVKLNPGEVAGWFRAPSLMDRLRARVIHADSESPGYEARLAVDGDPATCWHTAWRESSPPHPHEIQIALEKEVTCAGLRYTPRQDMRNGRVAEYELYVARSRDHWGEPVARGRFPRGSSPCTIRFGEPVRGRFLRFVAVSEVGGNPWTAVAELDLIPAP